ncbi:hypothetical protein AUEXF2481DRAFT_301130 [Aureobasidium subglaciale EXF-2481]|uniref:DUF2406 domain-containing protein n=1 Tax=Aureobasidium subglaciale (strain EXF-2481) TaxID=1043005 RepID=A0A074YI29_AURSE|nr:uncharacterized protein AUEXF2481DRAFT_301130 [Aureobasidium subglaciale EXF-2481]KAI5196215.1 hypothetical protein E4T38_08620 [Aureobasidium subglaciale]KAI5215020.1 hypothetical protein E4T40_08633 [Aureobasidium subglaciale]KAI5218200.1 hypothetical protein E4T41_08487 [Aureobasidium subglaciale]KAI5255924.1 hypothetical protein E4T46_08521 [Aureobasidium subglaciale]KEQ93737.1 hypothetical protein AUEXF2481DRAFT_301130 [Aureobasidium subglaciale EXF-2481]
MDQSSPSSRPRTTSRAFSHKSDHSRSSKHEVLVDSPADKQRRDSFWKGGSKANPNAAMNEAQPGDHLIMAAIAVSFPVTPADPNQDAAVMEKATMESLRNVQHKDSNGNVIAEPDLSNPTRPRWERPLDTIRSFERAIDGGYKRRSVSRSESYTYNNQDQSRRSSYYGANNHDSGRYENGSQYGGGHYGMRRPDGHSDVGTPGGPPSRNRYTQRMNSSRSNSGYGFYPQHSYNDSYDAGAQHSDGTGPWANSTDPSSENSSLDRANGVPKQNDPYGHDIYNGPPIMEEYASDSDGGYGMSHGNNRNGHAGGYPAAPTRSQAPPVRAPIKLGGAEGASNYGAQGGHLPPATRPTPVKEEKKKGFFKKRFSKG